LLFGVILTVKQLSGYMKLNFIMLCCAALFVFASCNGKDALSQKGGTQNLLNRANMDTTVKPGTNFFLYAGGNWLKKNPIPKSETRWGSFNELIENNNNQLHSLLDSVAAVKSPSAGSVLQKVADFYKSGTDSATIEKVGLHPLDEIFMRINNLNDTDALLEEIAIEHTEGLDILFSFGISPDDKNVTKEICQFSQGGLGMPSMEYYTEKDPRTVKIRQAYQLYIPKMLRLMGDDSITADKDAADIYTLEENLAKASFTRVEMRDPYKLYNKYNLAGANALTKGINWKTLLGYLKVKGEDSVIINTPSFFVAMSKQLKASSLATWKKYLKFHIVNQLAPYLASTYDNARFDFYGRTVRGQEEQKPKWKRVLSVIDRSVGEMLGKLYVDRYFKPEAKKRILELVNNLQATYAERIQKLDWMTAGTKKKALDKLNSFMKKIGYPDRWKDYSSLTIVSNDYVKNILSSAKWQYNFELNKLGRPVDRSEWSMTPPTVNAYYNPSFNEIVFPAGILQFPFFDENADDAVNYGGIGAVIGHEMTHGFDDQGRLYNAEGNLANWWTPVDSTNFTLKADILVEQFNKIIVIDTNHANGALTEGENLADLGGIAIAYEAFKKTKQGKSKDKIDGFTADQRFFLSWAQVWRANTRPEELASRLKTDPHSPSMLRCNEPIRNMDAWYKAFNIKPTDALYRPAADRAKVW
jgi:putative endopeptidase